MIVAKDLFSKEDLETTKNTLAGLIALTDNQQDQQALIKALKLVSQEISIYL